MAGLGDALSRRSPGVALQQLAPAPIAPQQPELYALLRSAHGYLAYAFFAIILLHLGAALYHALVRRDGVFEAMAPVPTRTLTDP
ncbi:cytochrome b [Pseudoroseomonas wenyumeiae]